MASEIPARLSYVPLAEQLMGVARERNGFLRVIGRDQDGNPTGAGVFVVVDDQDDAALRTMNNVFEMLADKQTRGLAPTNEAVQRVRDALRELLRVANEVSGESEATS